MSYELHLGDALTVLRTMPDASVQMCVTSPPYFGLRNYGCNGQIGLEPTPAAYVAALVGVFAEVWRVLKDTGTLWVNLGDSYAATTKGTGGIAKSGLKAKKDENGVLSPDGKSFLAQYMQPRRFELGDLKPKDLIGIPWRVAFALQEFGYYLRSDIIWHKPNPMPESVTDRPTKSHEYLFLLTKQERYYYDSEAVAEPIAQSNIEHYQKYAAAPTIRAKTNNGRNDGGTNDTQCGFAKPGITTRNRRSVWTVATQPYAGAHFATFPKKLIEPCILAGSRVGDTVLDCFNGSGTTGAVALEHGRNYIGIELNPAYIELAHERIRNTQPLLQAARP